MNRRYEDEAARTPPASHAPAPLRPHRSVGPKWGLWLTSLFVSAGAVLGVTLTGVGATATGVPASVQVGHQLTTSTAGTGVAPTRPSGHPTTTATPPTSATGLKAATTVVQPLATVTDREDSSGGDSASAGH
jgi:hypothetical protein